jgi:hypothetical protein
MKIVLFSFLSFRVSCLSLIVFPSQEVVEIISSANFLLVCSISKFSWFKEGH